SESVTGLTAASITVTNGTKGTLSGSGTTYTLPVTPTAPGAVTFQVTSGAAQDAVGNNNTASATASVTYDSVAPATASVTTPGDGDFNSAAGMPGTFAGIVADDSSGSGLNSLSTTFTLQRNSDNFYWNGSNNWQAGVVNLATTHQATTGGQVATWTSNVTLPT